MTETAASDHIIQSIMPDVRARVAALTAGETPPASPVPDLIREAIHAGHVAQLVIFCDDCGLEFVGDVVGETREDRFRAARAFLAADKGWQITDESDLCPKCTVTDPAAEVDAWNAAHKPGTLIQWRRTPGADFTETVRTWIPAYVLKSVATVRVRSGDFVPLSNIRIHPAAEQLDSLDKIVVRELYFPSPPCEFCNVDTSNDGDDGFTCPQCLAQWTSDGTYGTRRCVECRDGEAEVLGEDKQPRCLPCAAEVLNGELEATGPYQCRRCKAQVTGIGLRHGEAYAADLCGGCCNTKQRAADQDRRRAERTVPQRRV